MHYDPNNYESVESHTQPPTWFQQLATAREVELRGWVKTSAILWTLEEYTRRSGINWWESMRYESKTEALAQPEIQLNPSTASQYIAVYECFRDVPIETLERSRPRFLYQACKKVGNDPEKAVQAATDALSLSWSAFLQEWK